MMWFLMAFFALLLFAGLFLWSVLSYAQADIDGDFEENDF